MPYCKICGKESGKRVCVNCQYLLDNGADEKTIKKMLSDDATKKIWKDNERYSEELGEAYYDSVIENYPSNNDSKENFGYNTFVDGVRLGLDIVIPLLDKENQDKVVDKIKSMIKRSEQRKKVKELKRLIK